MITFSLAKWYEFECSKCRRKWCIRNWSCLSYCGAMVCPHCGILGIPVEEEGEEDEEDARDIADAIASVLDGRR